MRTRSNARGSGSYVTRSAHTNSTSDAVALGPRARLRDRDLGVVDSGDVPAERREPDRVLALAAREVERPSGLEIADLGDEKAVRLGRPQVLDGGVLRVPVLTPARGLNLPATR